jgi:hypothetical protein
MLHDTRAGGMRSAVYEDTAKAWELGMAITALPKISDIKPAPMPRNTEAWLLQS